MKYFTRWTGVIGIIMLIFASSVEAQRIGTGISLSVGYWKPNLEEANDALELWAELLDESDINPQGDDKFTGNFTFGGAILIGLNERIALRGELFYWKQTLEQTAHEEEAGSGYNWEWDGEASASIRIMPIVLSGQYYLGNLEGKVRPYLGGGLGLAFTSAKVEANQRVEVTSTSGNFSDSEDFKADDSGSSLMLQFFGGADFFLSNNMAFFAEGKYISGSFNVKENRNDIDEDVSLSGFQVNGGIRFYLGK